MTSNDVVLGLDGSSPRLAVVLVCMDPGLPTLLVLLLSLHTSQHAGRQLGANMELGRIGHAGVAGVKGRESLSVALTVKEVSSLGHCGMGTLWSECCVPLESVC